jgi:hypothetical protein
MWRRVDAVLGHCRKQASNAAVLCTFDYGLSNHISPSERASEPETTTTTTSTTTATKDRNWNILLEQLGIIIVIIISSSSAL